MDFLRRLHPGHADSPAAAQLERAPRWAALREAPRQAAAAQPFARPPADDTHPSAANAGIAPPAVPPAAVSEPGRARTAAATIVSVAPPRLFAMHTPTPDPRGVDDDAGPAGSRTAPPPGPPSAGADAPRPAAFAQPQQAQEAAVAAAPAKPLTAARPAPDFAAPLRLQTLQQAQRTAKADAAPVVHVTIDRIDVRVPAPAHASATARKPRAASAVAPLSDYLRTHPRSEAAR